MTFGASNVVANASLASAWTIGFVDRRARRRRHHHLHRCRRAPRVGERHRRGTDSACGLANAKRVWKKPRRALREVPDEGLRRAAILVREAGHRRRRLTVAERERDVHGAGGVGRRFGRHRRRRVEQTRATILPPYRRARAEAHTSDREGGAPLDRAGGRRDIRDEWGRLVVREAVDGRHALTVDVATRTLTVPWHALA